MAKILFCGDTAAQAQAAYLLGVLSLTKHQVQYTNSDTKFPSLKKAPDLLILSDYPAKNINAKQIKEIVGMVDKGMSLWMIGGWESFYGLNGEYTNEIGSILPVSILTKDDRVNSFCPYAIYPANTKHQILKGLTWASLPSIGGFNRIKVKKESQVILNAQKILLAKTGANISVKTKDEVPMLVEGLHGKGKTMAFLSDLAPHWSGGLVDWGNKRVQAKAKNAGSVEVGELYIKFIHNIVNYLCK